MMQLRPLALTAALFLACACDDDDDAPSAEATIQTSGGTVAVTGGSLAGAAITIPPGAVVTPTTVQIWADSISLQPGIEVVGPAARFEPRGTTFATPATITMPFDRDDLPPGTAPGDFRLGVRGRDGVLSSLVPTQVDQVNDLVVAPAGELAVFWVTVPDRVATADYLPLEDGNEYLFDTTASNRLSVDRVEDQPGLNVPAWLLTFWLPWFHRTGLLLTEDGRGGLLFVGLLQIIPESPAILEVNDVPVQYLAAIETIGGSRSTDYTFSGYLINNGIVTPSHNGTASLTVRTLERADVDTAVGEFEDTVVFEFEETVAGSGTRVSRVWLARGIGPVQLQFDGGEPIPLASGTVGGVPIRGR